MQGFSPMVCFAAEGDLCESWLNKPTCTWAVLQHLILILLLYRTEWLGLSHKVRTWVLCPYPTVMPHSTLYSLVLGCQFISLHLDPTPLPSAFPWPLAHGPHQPLEALQAVLCPVSLPRAGWKAPTSSHKKTKSTVSRTSQLVL